MLQEGICQQGQGLFGVEQHITTILFYLFKKEKETKKMLILLEQIFDDSFVLNNIEKISKYLL